MKNSPRCATLTLMLALIPAAACAQDLATTQDGRIVLLKPDGTWQVVGHVPAKDEKPQPAAQKPVTEPSNAPASAAQPASANSAREKSDQSAHAADRPTGQTTASGKTVYEGPRGGHYHYSASGKKVYEKKKR